MLAPPRVTEGRAARLGSCSLRAGSQPVCPQIPVAGHPHRQLPTAPGSQEGREPGWGRLRRSELVSGAPRIHTWALPHLLPCWSETMLEETRMDAFNGNSFVFIWSTVLQPLPHENARPGDRGSLLPPGLQSLAADTGAAPERPAVLSSCL